MYLTMSVLEKTKQIKARDAGNVEDNGLAIKLRTEPNDR